MSATVEHPWDGRPLTDEEIASEVAFWTERRKGLKGINFRLYYLVMNTFYFRALRQGQSMTEADETSNRLTSFSGGMAAGIMLTVVAFGSLGWLIGLFETLGLFEAVVLTFGWASMLWLTLKFAVIKTRLNVAFRWLKAKVRRPEGKRKKVPA